MSYVKARIKQAERDLTYQAYITDTLKILSGVNQRWVDVLDMLDRPVDTRSAEEIAADVMMRAGLRFSDDYSI